MKRDSSDCNLLCEVPPVLQNSRTALSPFLFIFLFLSKCWVMFLGRGMSLSISYIQLVFNSHRVKMRYLELNLLLPFWSWKLPKGSEYSSANYWVSGNIGHLLFPTSKLASPWTFRTDIQLGINMYLERKQEEIYVNTQVHICIADMMSLSCLRIQATVWGKWMWKKSVSAQHETSSQELGQLLQQWTFRLHTLNEVIVTALQLFFFISTGYNPGASF